MTRIFSLVLLFAFLGACLVTPTVQKRSVVGGRVEADVTDPHLKKILEDYSWKGAMEVNKMSNALNHVVPIRVAKVDTQVVSGVAYHMQVIYGQSACMKNRVKIEEISKETCPVIPEAQYLKCYITVWSQPWRKFEEVTNKGCQTISKAEAIQQNRMVHVPLLNGKGNKHLKSTGIKDKFAYPAFMEFLEKFPRSYTGDRREVKKRFRTFQKNINLVVELQKHERGSAKYGITKFSDMSPREFKKTILTPNWVDVGYPTEFAEIPTESAPDAWDWRDHGAVSNVKNQGNCGSCWAFSTTGNIEGQWAIKKGHLISLSEQELVDCDKLDQGCNGGLPANAYREIMRLGGLETEKEYPYDGSGETCSFKKGEVDAYINNSIKISQNEDDMKAWLYKNGPISIGINAFPMQFYWGGISHPWKMFCDPSKLDHGVLIVGYGLKGTEPYWIIKNSWGPDWGEKGYYLIYRGSGACGLNTMCTSAVID